MNYLCAHKYKKWKLQLELIIVTYKMEKLWGTKEVEK